MNFINKFLLLSAFSIIIGIIGCRNDDDGNGVSLISVESLSIEEGDELNTINVNIRSSNSANQEIVVIVSTKDGTAKAGEDYEAQINYPVVIPIGNTSAIFPVTILGDKALETNETFFVEIVSVSNGEIAQLQTEIVLTNDDTEFGELIPEGGYETPATYPDRTLIFSEEFDEGTIVTNNWTLETGTGQWGWGNNELQYYTDGNNLSLINGHLILEARNEFFGGKQYTSTRMKTKGAFDFKYGRVDIRAALPKGQGLWPALWMLGSNFDSVGWPECGEIDIMEILGHQPNKLYGTIHWKAPQGHHASHEGSTIVQNTTFNDEFHVFSIEWDETSIRWLLNDQEYHSIGTSSSEFDAFHKNFFLIMNVAVGGNWPGAPNALTEFPQRMVVDYVRVFQ